MAAQKTVNNVKLQVRVNNGTTASGAVAVKNVNFNYVKNSATDQQLYDAGSAVASLLENDLSGLRRIDTYDLADAE